MRLQLTVTHRWGPTAGAQGPSTAGRQGPAGVDVEVDAPDGSTAGELVAALGNHLRPAPTAPTAPGTDPAPDVLELVVAGTVVDPDAPVGLPPLLDGTAVALHLRKPFDDKGARALRPRRATVALAVTHGPDCGRSVDLPPGRLTIGRSGDVDLCLDDRSLSRRHAEVCIGSDGVTVRDLDSTNGTRVDGHTVARQPVTLTTASTLGVGDSVLALRHPGVVPAATTAAGDGTVAVNRRPRVAEPHPPATVRMPVPPTAPRRTRVPWVAVVLPVPVAAVLALVVGPTLLAFALMGPVLMLGTALSDRWGARRTYAAELVTHDGRLRVAQARVREACRSEARSLARSAPDPATILDIATGPSERLWERRRNDADAFVVALGRCRRDAAVEVIGHDTPEGSPRPQLEDAPCTLSLTEVGVLGVCGDQVEVGASARWLVGQLVTMHSPADLTVVALLRDADALDRWTWLSRIPHCRTTVGEDRRARGGVLTHDEATVTSIVRALADTIHERLSATRTGRWDGPVTLLVVDGAAAFRPLPELATVLADGPRVGIVCIALDTDRSALPHEARAVLDLPLGGPPVLVLPGHQHEDLVPDRVGPSWSERLGRSLAPLRDATPSTGAAALPASVGLADCSSPDQAQPGTTSRVDRPAELAALWGRRPHSTSVPLGMSGSGTFAIDLATDGPHVLVGGTTGAGKSELLRTLVATLALHNTPQHLSFVLVDYKGGAAFRDCADLPHVAGVVTDLDDHLAARALTSLTAELTRRERLLAGAGVTDFLSYQRSPAGQSRPLARLVVVVDEFRALAEELPAFVDGLVRLASLGRSLGIHLVLATQRPAGVVTADIKANVNLRIALRMRDRADSEDVVDSPAAAGVDPSTPGRAHARLGDGMLVEFQAAHVGAVRPGAGPRSIRIRPWSPFTETHWSAPPTLGERADRTELAEIVATTGRATSIAGLQPAPAAWLPPLPTRLPYPGVGEVVHESTVCLGLVDLPELQRQEPLLLDLRGRGHWAVVGGAGSGRTTALVTLARSATARWGPDRLHLYAVSGGSLSGLGALPQAGAAIDWSDLPRVERLVDRLSAEVATRRAALADRGFSTMAQWWTSPDGAKAPPPMLLLVDDWDLVASRHDDLSLATLVDRVLGLLREGEATGLTAVVAGGRSLLLGRAGATVSRRLVLRLSDATDAVLLGLAPRAVAALRDPGRCLTSDGHQAQLALPPDLPSRPPTGRPSGDSPGSVKAPLRVAALPLTVQECELAHHGGQRGSVAVGIGGDDADVVGLDPVQDGRRWLVTGAPGSGVSTSLLLVARTLVASGRALAVVVHRSGPLDALRTESGVTWCDGTDTAALVEARRAAPGLALVVDAADELLDHPVEAVVREVARLADRDHGLVVVGAGAPALASMYRGLAVEVARHRTGILLGPTSSADAQLLGVRVSVDRDARPGRGHLVRRGRALPLQVALPADGLPVVLPAGTVAERRAAG